MAMIKCDSCGAMMDPKGLKIHKRVEGELEIKSFFCQKCGREYIGVITNEEIRGDIRKNISAIQKNKLRKKSIDDFREKTLEKIHQLKMVYENGGENESTATSEIEEGNPKGLQNP